MATVNGGGGGRKFLGVLLAFIAAIAMQVF